MFNKSFNKSSLWAKLSLGLASLLTFVTPSLKAQDWAIAQLESSSRHQEWISIPNGDQKLEAFIVYPEVKEKATSVVIIHEIFGLSDWVRSVADQLAEAGYIAIAPDLLSGLGQDGAGTKGFEGRDALVKAVSGLDPNTVTTNVQATMDYVAALPAANGKVALAGFCWGGSQTFRLATLSSTPKACFVFYGSGPEDPQAIAKISVPIFGFYGEKDQRVNATIDKSQQLLKDAGKFFEAVIYQGAGHGFMRMGQDPKATPENQNGMKEAWDRLKLEISKL